jgi:hypothetical protein
MVLNEKFGNFSSEKQPPSLARLAADWPQRRPSKYEVGYGNFNA